jgi:hypothetical protein
MAEPKIHYVIPSETGYTVCGRYVGMAMQVTRDEQAPTCSQCLRELQDPARRLRDSVQAAPPRRTSA